MSVSSVWLLSRVRLFETPWTTAHQVSMSFTSSRVLPKLMSICQWCHPTITSSVVPFSSCPQSFRASGSLQMSQLFTSGGQIWDFSFNISPSNEHSTLISFRISIGSDMVGSDMVGSPCRPRDFQKSSPKLQFKSTNSLALSFLYSPTLKSIHDYWKNHSLD